MWIQYRNTERQIIWRYFKLITVQYLLIFIQNFGVEMRAVNRQMISVINVVITVVGSFFFGFSGITYAYPHLNLDLPTRFIFGLVPATIVFFCDLYFVVKGMDMGESSETQPRESTGETFSFKNMEAKKND